eukprot:761774-Hanusia_phi.AAC.7
MALLIPLLGNLLQYKRVTSTCTKHVFSTCPNPTVWGTSNSRMSPSDSCWLLTLILKQVLSGYIRTLKSSYPVHAKPIRTCVQYSPSEGSPLELRMLSTDVSWAFASKNIASFDMSKLT